MRAVDPRDAAVSPAVLLVDLGVAIVAAIVVLAITPGLAVAAPIALVVLTVCGLSSRRGSGRGRPTRKSHSRYR
jgi:uncharacterized RDD family membrane protein YckC